MPPHTTDDKAAVIRYWHAVELLSPQTVPFPSTRKGQARVTQWCMTYREMGARSALVTTEPAGEDGHSPNRTWSHLVYGHCFDYRLIVDLLEQHFGADNGYRETRESIAGLYAPASLPRKDGRRQLRTVQRRMARRQNSHRKRVVERIRGRPEYSRRNCS